MTLSFDVSQLKEVLLVGDRVLIKPRTGQEKTKSGLLLPPSVQENEPIKSGYVVKTGPGFPIPLVNDLDEPWKEPRENVKYVPLQSQEGDLAIFLQNNGWEIRFNNEVYYIVPHSAILMLIRNNDLFS